MNLFEIAWRWTVLLLAEVLNASASVVEAILRSQPRWVAKVRLLEEHLRSGVSRQPSGPAATSAAGGPTAGGGSTEALLQSYAILSQALKDLEARGLSLDDGLLDRMTREWTNESIVGYLRSSETQLKQNVSGHLDRAAAALGDDATSLIADRAGRHVGVVRAGPAPPATGAHAKSRRSTAASPANALARRRNETVR